MYFIRKYSDCWAIHDADTGESRPLTNEEADIVKDEFPDLIDDTVRTIFTDNIKSINPALRG